MNSKLREERAAAGLCTQCGGLLDTDGRMCSVCREKRRLETAETRQYYRLHGICPECKKEIIFSSEKRCPECRAKAATEEAERNKRLTEEQKALKRKRAIANKNALRARRKAAGVCIACGKRNAQKNRAHCSICLARQRERSYEHYRERNENYIPRNERVAYGLCYVCGKQLDREGSLCKKCKDRAIINLKIGCYKSAYYKAGNSQFFYKTDVKKIEEIGKIWLNLKEN